MGLRPRRHGAGVSGRGERVEPAAQPGPALAQRPPTPANPVGLKARVIGQNLLHGKPIPANAYF
jgi:hypothetical protein